MLGIAPAADETDSIIEVCIADEVCMEDAKEEEEMGAKIVVWGDDGTVVEVTFCVVDDIDCMEGEVTLHEGEDDEFC